MQKKGLIGSAFAMGVLSLAMSSAWAQEAPKLTAEESRTFVRQVVRRAGGKVPVVGLTGTGGAGAVRGVEGEFRQTACAWFQAGDAIHRGGRVHGRLDALQKRAF